MPEPSLQNVRILIVEDDVQVVPVVREAFAAEGTLIDHAATIAKARALFDASSYDAVILDLSLPDGDGLSLADAWRRTGSEVPVLMLTARQSVDERVAGFSHGADDYLGKPFEAAELRARVHAILRRTRSARRYALVYRDISLDLLRRRVTRGELAATLSAREMELLAYMMRRPELVLTREKILEEVWGGEPDTDSNVLNVYVNYLRNKLERSRYPRVIHAVRGTGYVLSVHEPNENA